MIQLDEPQKKKFKTSQVIYAVLTIGFPLVYLGITQVLNLPPMDPTANQMTFQMLILVALIEPVFLIPLIEKAQTKQFKQNKAIEPVSAFMSLMIIRAALVEAIYIFGMIVYFTTHNLDWMLYFYPIGILATIIYFPRESTLQSFIEKVQTP